MRPSLLPALALTASVVCVHADDGPRPAKPGNLDVWLTGDPADAPNATVNGPALLLMGGSSEVTAAFRDRAYPVINGGDIVVFRTSGTDGYNNYLYDMVTGPLKPNSVETVRVNTRAKADTDYVEWVAKTAEMIWFAGGDQSTYTENWRGTKLEAGVREAWSRGAVIGGTSAGLAILGEFIYDPGSETAVTTATATANPYAAGLIISDRMFDFPWLDDIITDTHFRERDRMGRSLAFMARLRQDGRTERIGAVSLSERTSMFINKDGIGIVDGNDAAYIMLETPDTQRVQVAPGQPLKYSSIARFRLSAGKTFDFNDWSTSEPPMTLSVDGTQSPVYTPEDPYADVEPSGIASWMAIH